MPPDTACTACPRDWPSTHALEVESLDDGRIGRVRGTPISWGDVLDNTAGAFEPAPFHDTAIRLRAA